MIELLERFIVAFENFVRAYCEAHAIRAALTGEQHACKCAGPQVGSVMPDGGVVVEQMTAAPIAAAYVAVGPEKMVVPEAPNYKGVTDYDTLRRLCQDRKIAVPPRTKTTTLVKWLQQDDLAKAAPAAPPVVAAPVLSTPVVHTDPPPVVVAQPPTPVEADPFQADPPAPAKDLTREDVIEVLQALKAAKGIESCKRVVIEHGGVALVKDIPASKWATVYAAAQEELK